MDEEDKLRTNKKGNKMNKQIEDIVKKQFAIDYNCCPSDFNNCETIVTPMEKK